ncbi:MAG: transglycosylase family protein [Blastocatellia bacterium]|nr:transglycosylase family protein [Blastocatellia bacterium]
MLTATLFPHAQKVEAASVKPVVEVISINIDNIYTTPVRAITLPKVKQPEPIPEPEPAPPPPPPQPVGLPSILIKIRQCESRGNYQAQNSRSTASGAYQFIDGTWANYKGYQKAKHAPNHIQDEKALLTYQRSGTTPWNASKQCWGIKTSSATNLTVNSRVVVSSSVIKLYADRTNNCVAFAKAKTGIYRTLGNGARSGIQGHEPRVGAIAVVKGSIHAGVVVAISGNMVTIHESNYIKNWIVQRTLPISMFLGYAYN